MPDHRIGGRNHDIHLLVRKARFLEPGFGKIEYQRQDHAAASPDGLLKQVIGLHVLGLRKEHVEHDDLGAVFRKTVHDARPHRPGPGKASQLVDALLVDGRDHGLGARGDLPPHVEPHVEGLLFQDLEEPGIHQVKDGQHHCHDQCYVHSSAFAGFWTHISSLNSVVCRRQAASCLLSLTPFPRRSPAFQDSAAADRSAPGP